MSDENGIFQPLEILEKRPNPIPFEKIKINKNNEEKEEMEERKNEKMEEEIEEIDEIKENEPLQVKIVDHRRKRLIDRNAILNRIKSNFEVNIVDNVNREKEVPVMKPVREIEIAKPVEQESEKEIDFLKDHPSLVFFSIRDNKYYYKLASSDKKSINEIKENVLKLKQINNIDVQYNN